MKPTPPAPARPRRRQVLSNQEEGTISGSSSVGTSKNKVENQPVDLSIPHESVPDQPGLVRVGLGMTESLGNYEFLRVDVSVSLPCGTSDSEVRGAAERAGALAAEFIEDERRKALGTDGITSK